MDLNKQDGGDRTFILCQLDEDLDRAASNATGNALQTIKNQIEICDKIKRHHKLSEITAERIRRIMLGKSLDGTKDFPWMEKNSPYGGNLDVYEIGSVANFESAPGKTPLDVIDETLYGKEKFGTLEEKVRWISENFANAQKTVEGEDAARSH